MAGAAMAARCSERSRPGGFSLVEILVAALILGVVIASVAAVVRKSRELDTTDNHRREARALADSLMETRYHESQYDLVDACDVTWRRILDPVLDSAVVREVVQHPASEAAADGDVVPVKRVTVTVWWTEPDGRQDTVAVSKWLAN